MGSLDARWSFLRDWCAPMRGRLSFEFAVQPRLPLDRFGGLGVKLPRERSVANLAMLRGIRYVLALLAVTARADAQAWRHALVEYCELDIGGNEDVFESELFVPRFVVCPEEAPVVKEDAWPACLLKDFTTSADQQEEEAFSATVKQIASMIRDKEPASETIEIPLTVVISLAFLDMDDSLVDTYARFMWDDVARVESRAGSRRFFATPASNENTNQLSPQCVFVVTAVEVDATGRTLTLDMLELLDTMVTGSFGTVFSELAVEIRPCERTTIPFGCEAVAVGSLLVPLLCGTSYQYRGVLEAVRLDCDRWTEPQFARLCSAIAATQSTEQLSLSLNMRDANRSTRTLMWEMLAYTLFSKHSCSSVTSVTLRGTQISTEDAEAMEIVLDVDSPTNLLFGAYTGSDAGSDSDDDQSELHETSPTAHHSLTLQCGTTVSLQPMHPDEPTYYLSSWSLLNDIHCVSVLKDDNESDYVKVLVPGYGVCKVDRDEVDLAPVDADQHPAKAAVTSLTLQLDSRNLESRQELSHLLKLVGTPLTYLSIQIRSPIGRLQVDDLLKWCPNLKTLIVYGIVVDTASLVQACRDTNVHLSQLQCILDNVPLLAAELVDPGSPLASSLRRIAIATRPSPTQALETCVAIDRMLRENHTLEYVDMMAPMEAREQSSSTALELGRLHNELAVHEPLSLGCRLAFISVISGLAGHSHNTSNKRARATAQAPIRREPPRLSEALDRHVVSSIFDYAASASPRRVYVRRVQQGGG